jgi:hypothetical protein
MACVDRTQAWAHTGTHTNPTIYNLRTDTPMSSLCNCGTAFNTVNITTAPVESFDLARREVKLEKAAAGECAVIVDLKWSAISSVAPFIVGPACLLGHFGGTTVMTGYAKVMWAEWQKSELGL